MISVIVEQHRGTSIPVRVKLSLPAVPRKGDRIRVFKRDSSIHVSGFVEEVTHDIVPPSQGLPQVQEITITLIGWKRGFGKD